MTLAEFIAQNGLSMTAETAPSNPHMADPDWPADHWRCRIRKGRRSMTVYFSQGVGHHGAEPELARVLDCLASDSAGVENAEDFEGWCAEYGYDTDSRKAERTYRQCKRQAAKLRAFLGADGYDALLWHTDRD